MGGVGNAQQLHSRVLKCLIKTNSISTSVVSSVSVSMSAMPLVASVFRSGIVVPFLASPRKRVTSVPTHVCCLVMSSEKK